MTTPAEPKQEDMFQSIGDRVNEVSSTGNNVEEENFTVDEPQIVDNIGTYIYVSRIRLLGAPADDYRIAMHELS